MGLACLCASLTHAMQGWRVAGAPSSEAVLPRGMDSTWERDGAAQGFPAWLERWQVYESDILQHPQSRGWAGEGLLSLCSGLGPWPSGAHSQVTLAFYFFFLRSFIYSGIPGWRSGLAPAFGPGRDPGDTGSNPTSGSRCMEPASPSAYVSASLSLCV